MSLYRVSGVPGMVGKQNSAAAHAVAAVALFGPRNAFLLLVDFNVFGLAFKMKEAITKNVNAVKDFWYNKGGDYSKLVDAVNKGITRNRIFGVNENTGVDCLTNTLSPDYGPGVGIIVPASAVAIGSTFIAAIPIILAVIDLLKSLAVRNDDIPRSGSHWPPVGYNENGQPGNYPGGPPLPGSEGISPLGILGIGVALYLILK